MSGTERPRGGGTSRPSLAGRWQRLFAGPGRFGACHTLQGDHPGPPGAGELPDRQIDVSEMFVDTGPEPSEKFDPLCAVLVERGSGVENSDLRQELTVFGPERIRTHTKAAPRGLTATDLRVGPEGTDLRSVSVIVFRAPRRPRIADMVASIEDLGRVLDHERGTEGAVAVACVVVSRLEVLLATEGVTVPVAGTARFSAHAAEYRMMVDAGAAPSSGRLEVRRGRVTAVGPQGGAVPWREADFVLVGTGRVPALGGETRTIGSLRRQHLLNDSVLAVADVPAEQSWNARAASTRQASRAERIVRYAVQGDLRDAHREYRLALAQPGADGPLGDNLVGRVTTLGDYWRVAEVIRDVPDAPPAARFAGSAVGRRFDAHLESFLDLGALSDEARWPLVNPLALEVGDDLVPIVDSRQDGGHFLQELLPEMRQRVQETLGVRVPALRARASTALWPGQWRILVDEVPVRSGTTDPDASYAVLPYDKAVSGPEVTPTGIHPLTGERASFLLAPVPGPDDDGPERLLTAAQQLIHQLELVARAYLARHLGPAEVGALVAAWTEEGDSDLVTSTLPDGDARLRLTWLLQALVRDGVPITDWRRVLRAVRDADAWAGPRRALRRTVRAAFQDRLPRPGPGEPVCRIPEEHEALLTLVSDRHRLGIAPPGREHLAFLTWVQEAVADSGPALTLVAANQDTREAAADVVRFEQPFVVTLAEEELVTP